MIARQLVCTLIMVSELVSFKDQGGWKKWMDYEEVLKSPLLKGLLRDEGTIVTSIIVRILECERPSIFVHIMVILSQQIHR